MADPDTIVMSQSAPSSRTRRLDAALRSPLLPWLGLAGFVVVLVRTAWLCDDAYITFRTIGHFLAGDGLRWNLADRVQAFTHPLWLFVLSAFNAITGDLYYTTLAVSMALSLAAVWLIATRLATTATAGFTCATVLLCSRSFVDYSTSGLENPLTHLLLAGFAWVFLATETWTPRRLFQLSLLAGLLATNRLDALVLVAPALAWAAWRGRGRRGLLAVLAGLSPLVLWETFSLVYYGFLVPNTAYAKLPAAISLGSRLSHGAAYLQSCLRFDPLAGLVIVAALLVPPLRRRWPAAMLSAGVAADLLYVVYVGGDFMAGRFLTGALVLAVIALARAAPPPDRAIGLMPAYFAVALSLSLGYRSPLRTGPDYGWKWRWPDKVDERDIADERAFYYADTGLLRKEGALRRPVHAWFDEARKLPPRGVAQRVTIGFFGWAAPRDAYIIDTPGLADPLLARLPPRNTRKWRAGHLHRLIPAGYSDTRRRGEITMNRWLAEYYRELRLVTAGPLWDRARWRAIWRLNTGALDHLLVHHADFEVPAARLAKPRPDGTPRRARGNISFDRASAIYVRLPASRTAAHVLLAAEADDDYTIELARGDAPVWRGVAGRTSGDGLTNRRIDVPAGVGPFDAVIVRGGRGDGRYVLGHLGFD